MLGVRKLSELNCSQVSHWGQSAAPGWVWGGGRGGWVAHMGMESTGDPGVSHAPCAPGGPGREHIVMRRDAQEAPGVWALVRVGVSLTR